MKKIAIFCRSFEMGVEPFTSDYYWQAYQDLFFALKERGLDPYFTTDNNSYRDYGLFDVAYTTTEKKATPAELTAVRNVRVDMVFDRGGFIGRNVPTVNPAILQKVAMNKAETYKYFADYQPDSVVCNTEAEVIAAFDKLEGDSIVVKDLTSFGGKGVYIGKKQDVLQRLPHQYPLLVQEFLDTSAGVPGFMTGVHDVRLSVAGGTIIGYYIRKAKEGELHSNVSKGGTMIFFDTSRIPAELVELVEEIDTLFARWPRYYSIDFMYTPKGWKMLEINRYLALLPLTDGEEARVTTERLADYLAEVCRHTNGQQELLVREPADDLVPQAL